MLFPSSTKDINNYINVMVAWWLIILQLHGTIFAKSLYILQIRINALIKKGSTLIQQGKSTDALDCFAKAVRLDPDNADIYHHRGHVSFYLDFSFGKQKTYKFRGVQSGALDLPMQLSKIVSAIIYSFLLNLFKCGYVLCETMMV